MTRILKILSYAVVIFLVYLLVLSVFNKWGNDEMDTSIEEKTNSLFGEDEFFDDEDYTLGEEKISVEETPQQPAIDYDVIDKTLAKRKEEQPPKAIPVSEKENVAPVINQSPIRSNTSYGEYMVIAGSYIIHSNAGSMVGKLHQMGYKSAEVVIFDLSQYHSVVAARTDDHNRAMTIVSELKSKGIDSYVHRKK